MQKMPMRPSARAIIALLFLIALSGCVLPWKVKPPKVRVAASFYPVAYFARQVAGDHAEVITVIPSGLDPHDFDPTPKKLMAAYSSDLFLYNGAGLEPWADRIRPELEGSGIRVIRMSDSVDLMSGVTGKETRDQNQADPHIWIDPVLAQGQVERIRDALIEIDPPRANDYREHAANFISKLSDLDSEFRNGLSSCRHHTVILSHAAFQYLAKRYGFKTLSVSGLSPNEEPTPRHLMDLVDEAKKLNIHFIFFEKRTNPKMAEMLASEIEGETLDMYHIDGGFTPEEALDPNLYLDQMRKNLNSLKKALQCQ